MHDCLYNRNIILSFQYAVSNKNYTIEYITKKTKDKCNDIIYSLFQKLEEISKTQFIKFQNMPKASGYEMIPLNEFNFSLNSDVKKALQLTNDSKIIVFRFGQQNYRLFMVQSKTCPYLMYVIGFDWKYNAYKH